MAENEFKKINWNDRDISHLEKQRGFNISDEILMDSYIYKHLEKRIIKKHVKPIKKVLEKVNFVPGIKYKVKNLPMSYFDGFYQEHILKATKLLLQNKPLSYLSERERFSMNIYDQMKGKILEENNKFIEFVKTSWEYAKNNVAGLENNLFRYGKEDYLSKTSPLRNLSDSYRQIEIFNASPSPDETEVEFKLITTLLQLGTQAKFSKPSLEVECRLCGSSMPEMTRFRSYSQLPVSEDKNIKTLIKKHDFDVVISSSALKRILNYSDVKSKWSIPVTVQTFKQDNGNDKKIVFIDKPLPNNVGDPLDFKTHCMKRLLRTNFCQFEAFKYDDQDEFPDKELIDINERLTAFEKQLEDEGKPIKSLKKKEIAYNKTIHHNANYKLWSVRKKSKQNLLVKNKSDDVEFNILIRSKLDGVCEMEESPLVPKPLQPIIVTPKVELQLEFGANVPTKNELSKEWTSLFFRPYSLLYRARMHWKTAEVVSLEKCTLQKVTNEATSLYNFNPYLGLEVLATVMNKLRSLEEGSYLLRHLSDHGNFISILSESHERNVDFSMNSEYADCQILRGFQQSWVPIDLNYILPMHDHFGRPPGLFNAKPNRKGKVATKKKKGKRGKIPKQV